MKKLSYIFILLISFLLISSYKGSTANHYASSPATGSADGTSWANAWDIESISWGSISPGDTVFIDGGSGSKTYTATSGQMFSISASGTAGNPITIATGAKSPFPSGHDGTVIFEGSDTYTELIYCNGQSYIILDGEKSGSRNWTIQNASFSDVENPIVTFFNTDNSKITYLTITSAAIGILASYADGLELSYCEISDIGGDTCIRNIITDSSAEEFGLKKFHHNIFQVNTEVGGDGSGPDGIQSGSSSDIYSNLFYSVESAKIVGNQHCDYIQSAGRFHRIFNNTFRNPIDSAVDVGFGWNWGYQARDLHIFNNVFTSDSNSPEAATHPTGIRMYTGPYSQGYASNIIVANNTMVDLRGVDNDHSGRPFYWRISEGLVGFITNVYIVNNLFYNTAAGAGNAHPYDVVWIDYEANLTAADFNFDYNLVNAGALGTDSVVVNGSSYTQTHPRTGVPSFVSYVNQDLNNDYRLTSDDTVAKNFGLDMSAYFSVDKNNTPRAFEGWGGGWDVGAYESVETVYYVREAATGDDSGSDWDNAYTELPNPLDRGAIYYIADGTYPTTYDFNDSDVGTQKIIIKKATEAINKNDTGWNSSYGDGEALFGKTYLDANYMVLEGLVFDGDVNNFVEFGLLDARWTAPKHWIIANCILRLGCDELMGLYCWSPTTGPNQGNVYCDEAYGIGIGLSSSSEDFLITGCEFDGENKSSRWYSDTGAVQLNGTGNIVTNCFFHDLADVDCFHIFGEFKIVDCIVSNTVDKYESILINSYEDGGAGDPKEHADTFQAYDAPLGPGIIERVTVIRNGAQLGNFGFRNPTYKARGPGIDFRNCIFREVAAPLNLGMPAVRFYNNIFYRCCATNFPYGAIVLYTALRGDYFDGFVAQNNVFLKCGTTGDKGIGESTEAGTTMSTDYIASHNYFGANGYAAADVFGTDYVAGGDPKFVDEGTDFHIESGSVLINAGVWIDTFNEDFDKNIRGGTWDIGPYELESIYSSTIAMGAFQSLSDVNLFLMDKNFEGTIYPDYWGIGPTYFPVPPPASQRGETPESPPGGGRPNWDDPEAGP